MDKSYRTFRLLIVHTRTMLKLMANLACWSQLPRLTRPETIATRAMTNLKKKIGCNRSYYDSKIYFGLQVGNSCPSNLHNKDDKFHNAFSVLPCSIIHILTRVTYRFYKCINDFLQKAFASVNLRLMRLTSLS